MVSNPHYCLLIITKTIVALNCNASYNNTIFLANLHKNIKDQQNKLKIPKLKKHVEKKEKKSLKITLT